MNYTSYLVDLRTLAVTTQDDAAFNSIVPDVIDYAEKRIYRDLDLLNVTVSDSTATFTVNQRSLAMPAIAAGEWITVQQVNVITPIGATAANGTRTPLTPASRQALNVMYGSATGAGVPAYFAMEDATTIAVGPWPDAAYRVEFVGTYRPNPLSPTNPTTILTRYFPDLFMAASMIFVTGYQRDFGQQSDDPARAQSWESQYKNLVTSAATEEARKKLSPARGE